MSERRPCPSPKCIQLNKPDARFCARCGRALSPTMIRVSDTIRPEPQWVFTVVFIGFFLMVLLPIVNRIGAVSFIFVPFILVGLRKIVKHKRARRNAGLYGADFTERLP